MQVFCWSILIFYNLTEYNFYIGEPKLKLVHFTDWFEIHNLFKILPKIQFYSKKV